MNVISLGITDDKGERGKMTEDFKKHMPPTKSSHWAQHEGWDSHETTLFLLGVDFPDETLIAAHLIIGHVKHELSDYDTVPHCYAPSACRVEQEEGKGRRVCFFWDSFNGEISLVVSSKIVSLRFKEKTIATLGGIDFTNIEEKKIKKEGKYIVVENNISDCSFIKGLLPRLLTEHL